MWVMSVMYSLFMLHVFEFDRDDIATFWYISSSLMFVGQFVSSKN